MRFMKGFLMKNGVTSIKLNANTIIELNCDKTSQIFIYKNQVSSLKILTIATAMSVFFASKFVFSIKNLLCHFITI